MQVVRFLYKSISQSIVTAQSDRAQEIYEL